MPKLFYQKIDSKLAWRLDKRATIFDEEESGPAHGSGIMKYNPLTAQTTLGQKMAVKIILELELKRQEVEAKKRAKALMTPLLLKRTWFLKPPKPPSKVGTPFEEEVTKDSTKRLKSIQKKNFKKLQHQQSVLLN